MSIARIRQEDEEVLRDSLPYHWLKGLAQNEEEEARRRRHVAPPPPPPPAEALAIIVPVRRERAGRRFHTCRCPACDYEMSLEEGQKCNLMECPLCSARMRGVSSGISQVEAVPIAPLLVTFGLFGLLALAIAKRPLG